jgi:hypothetical protein
LEGHEWRKKTSRRISSLTKEEVFLYRGVLLLFTEGVHSSLHRREEARESSDVLATLNL